MSRARDLADGNFSGDLEADSPTFVVDSANNRVGVGTASPQALLDVVESGAPTPSNTFAMARIAGSDSVANDLQLFGPNTSQVRINFGDPESAQVGDISYSHGSNYMRFTTSGAERMRIDSSGNFHIAKTGTDDTVVGFSYVSGDYMSVVRASGRTAYFNRQGSAGANLEFGFQNSTVGTISVDTGVTSYNTSSDYRLKQDWVPIEQSIERVKALKPVNFAWKVNNKRIDGFIAHEVQEVVPEAVTGSKDAMRDEEYVVTPAVYDDEGNLVSEAVMGTRSVPDYQGIDQSKLVPLLTAALQEALQKIDALEARVATLEGGA